MNKILKRGFSTYKIIIKNKLAASIMMLASGAMMVISAANGRGNDTKTIPTIITFAGVIFSLWGFYRLGYIKANYDKLKDKLQKDIEKRVLIIQAIEASVYIVVTIAGIYLLMNEKLMDLILNLVTGGFMVYNGIMGIILIYKRRQERNYRWFVRLVLTIFELIGGIFYLITANRIEANSFLMMGVLTTVAGTIEVIASASREAVKNTVQDGKDMVRTIKNGSAE